MAPRFLPSSNSLETLRLEIAYTLHRLEVDSDTRELATPIREFSSRVGEAGLLERQICDAELLAQVGMDHISDRLGLFIHEFGLELLALVAGNRAHPRYLRFFATRPSGLARMALRAKLLRLADWGSAFEAEPELAAYRARFETLLAEGRAAVEALERSEGNRRNWRLGGREILFADGNAARMSLEAQLIRHCLELGRPRDWPTRFFRRTTLGARANPAESLPS